MSANRSNTRNLVVPGSGQVELTIEDRGQGQPFLLLHGGGGAQSVSSFAALVATREHARVLLPTHPGFDGTPRPDGLNSMARLAALYGDLLDSLGLEDVTVIGNSVGGWIAAEMALLGSPRISGMVLVDAVGIEVEGHPVADPFAISRDELIARSYHDPDRFLIDPSTLTEEQRAGFAANLAALKLYSGSSMMDPTLLSRLRGVEIPTLVLWGESDRVADPEYGRTLAAAIHWARFELLPATGHMPQIESPELLLRAIWDAGETPYRGTYTV